MDEKMRAEFEEWAQRFRLPLHRDGNGYVEAEIDAAWQAWQASRAALVVELPERISKESGYSEDDEYYNLALDHCRSQIESTGVRVRT